MDDVFICDGIRTPIGRYGGGLGTVRPDDLGAMPIRALLERNAGLDPAAIDEVFYGCSNQAGEDCRNVARMSSLLSGLPDSVPALTVNRLCGSGLEAVAYAARATRSGEVQLSIAGGTESMSRAPMVQNKAQGPFDRNVQLFDSTIGWRFVNPEMERLYGIDSMPETAENLAQEMGISREDQDAFALRSQQRFAAAEAEGYFEGEILPVEIKGRKGAVTTVSADEHPRRDADAESLARLRPIVMANGTVTAGNASGVNDGAAALIVASAAAVERHGLTPRARILGMASAGCPPRIMGYGPVPATRKLIERLGHQISDYDVIELNEAFAAQALTCMRDLGLPDDASHVNPHGGAIAMGHPLGMSGARLVLTAVRALEKSGGRLGLATMCVGIGQGVALAVERVA